MAPPHKGKGKARASEAPKTEAVIPFGKQLSHTDKEVRDQAVRNLVAFLSRGGDPEGDDAEERSGYVRLEEKEMAKLWKGLFYCFWMSDKPLVQQGLATELSDLLLKINPRTASKAQRAEARLEAAIAFLEGFWVALVREWNGIDRLRIDKYYMLIRRYVNATFRLLARAEWSEQGVEGVNSILSAKSGPMSWQDISVPMSLATHLADVYLTELDKVLADSEGPAPLLDLLAPFIQLAARTRNATVHKRIMDIVFKPLLTALKDGDHYENIGAKSTLTIGGDVAEPSEVRAALLRALFNEAAKETAVESNRRRIYQLVREEEDEDDE